MMKTCKEKAAEWGLSIRSINSLCKQGKITGAPKIKGAWQIPDNAEKPIDGRITSGKYTASTKPQILKSLPISRYHYGI